jgi:hypothetical protein
MRSTLSWVWIVLVGGVVLSVCVALARGAEHPALAALGSTCWIAAGAALAWWHARSVRSTAAAPADAPAPRWPVVAPVLAGLIPALGGALMARGTGRLEWLALTALFALLALLAGRMALGGRRRRDAAALRRALLVVGLPASGLALIAPAWGLVAGFKTPLVILAIQGFTFGGIPGLWCAGAWRLGLGGRAREHPDGPMGLHAGA